MLGSLDRGATRAQAGSRELSPDDFSFHGFDELSRDELRKIIRLGIRDGEPKVSIVDSAIFIPAGFDLGPEQPKFAGGVVRPDGTPIETAQMHRKGGKRIGGLVEAVAVKPEREIEDEVIYLGPLFNHYGRVLLESLARVWYLSDAEPSAKVTFTTANAAQAGIAPWVAPLLEAFGIPPARMLALDRPTRLKQAIVPEPLFEQFYSAHKEMVRPFRDIARRLAGDIVPSVQPVYLSRRLLSSRQRPIVGEPELEELLRENGFLIASPETMSVEDQVRLVNGHSDIFSCIGSAAHNVLFALHRPHLHLLASRDDIPANYFLCSELADVPTTFVNCLGSGGRPTPNDERLLRREGTRGGGERRTADPDAGPQAMPQLLNLDAIVAYLRERNFLKRPAMTTSDTLGAELQERFDEAWFYARIRKAASKSGSLPPELEAEAAAIAERSWPVSLMLARFHVRNRDSSRVETLVRQFLDLVAAESNTARLNYFRGDVESMASRVSRLCKPETVSRFNEVLAGRFIAGQGNGSRNTRK